jgi:nitrate reductase delta subunit
VVNQEDLLPPREKTAVLALIEDFDKTGLMELQQRYVALFDRGRALSLHIFEHVHGESRDRGQAMVDLLNHYRAHGFEISVKELPDYIPLFLEYLSQRSPQEARALLGDAMPVLSLLGARLAERDSPYHVLFQALEGFTGAPENIEEIRASVAAEGPDESLVHMDKIWEEEAVTFMATSGGNCGSQPQAEAPVQWVPRRKNSSR